MKLKNKWKIKPSQTAFPMLFLWVVYSAFSQPYLKIGESEQCYDKKALQKTVNSAIIDKFLIDAPIATIRVNTKIRLLYSNLGNSVFNPPCDRALEIYECDSSTGLRPFDNRVLFKKYEGFWKNNSVETVSSPGTFNRNTLRKIKFDTRTDAWFDNAYITNIYECANGGCVGFVHLESSKGNPFHAGNWFYCDSNSNSVRYSIGLAYSTDTGESRIYCGDIIAAGNPDGNCGRNNIGGIPYVVRNDSLYVYFNEYDAANRKRISVARASILAVQKAAEKGTVSLWEKYGEAGWQGGALAQGNFGANIIPKWSDVSFYDTHSDAAYCPALKKYVLLVCTGGNGKLLLYTSLDALHWGKNPVIIEDEYDCSGEPPVCTEQIHAFIVSFNRDASPDCSVVGKEFYVYYIRQRSNSDQTLLRKKITISESIAK